VLDTKIPKEITKFLSESSFLVVSLSPTTRASIIRLLIDSGAKLPSILSAGSYKEGIGHLTSQKVNVVISDFKLNGSNSASLIFSKILELDNQSRHIFIVVNSSQDQASIAQSAEEDIDGFLLSPFSAHDFISVLSTSITKKLSPLPGDSIIVKGLELLNQGKAEESLEFFRRGMEETNKKALSCYYYAKAKIQLKQETEAMEKLLEGLSYDKLNYKCLIGLYELCLVQNRKEKAYDIVKKISKIFPANPKRLPEIIQLALDTKNYVDIEFYFDIYLNFDDREAQIPDFLLSSLFQSGVYFIQNSQPDKAISVFRKLSSFLRDNTSYLSLIIEVIYLNNLRDELSYYSKKVLEIKNDTEREVVDFVCTFHDKDPYVTSQAGLKLLNQKKFSKAMLHLLITKLGETTKSNLHEEVMDVASKLFPNDFSIKG